MDKRVADTEDIVTLIDFNRMIEWICVLVEKLDRISCEKICEYYNQERDVLSEVGPCESGAVWVHSSLGGGNIWQAEGRCCRVQYIRKTADL